MKSLIAIALAPVLVAAAVPHHAAAQARGTVAQREANDRQAAELRTRLASTEARIGEAQRSRAITRARADELRRQVAAVRRSVTQLSRRQGFVSAAEFASYDRTLGEVDAALGHHGTQHSYGNDALPSAEVLAFKRTDARLRYRDARVEFDANNCAVYRGIARDGRVRQQRLLTPAGKPICTRR